MRSDEVKEVKVGEYDQVADGNFVTVEYPAPTVGLAAAANIQQLLQALSRGTAPVAEEVAPASKTTKVTTSASGTTRSDGDAGKTASKSDVDKMRDDAGK
jgi:hypothetical protein